MNKEEFYKYQEYGMGMIEGVGKDNYFIINNAYVLGDNANYALNNPQFIAFNKQMEISSPEFDSLDDLKQYLQENFTTTIFKLRKQTNMNIKEFAEYFNVPYRTMQNWELDVHECPEYLVSLMKYKLEKENRI